MKTIDHFIVMVVVVWFEMVRAEPVIVKTMAGEIHGITSTINYNSEEIDVSLFLGIPYALPPTGNLRFARPVKASKFDLPYIANETKSSCMQVVNLYAVFNRSIKALNEDCLNLNVIVPGTALQSDQKRSVMVWIYGGGFIEGSQDVFISPGFAVLNDVIYVTLNYRLGVFGFLSTGGYDITGNYGLWDQHMALQWVHDNIGGFGGDPDKVTIFGESAGAASVIYQALYRGNDGLFKGVIAESGTVGNDWSFVSSPLDTFDKIVKNTNCTGSKRSDSIACLRELDSTILLNSVTGIQFPPSVDREFVLMDPKILFANTTHQSADVLNHFGKLDLVIGVNSDDGALVLALLDPFGNSTGFTKALFDYLVSQINSVEAVNIAAAFQYTDWSNPEGGATQMLLDFYSDYMFNAAMIKTVQVHASMQDKGKTFVYLFDHRSSRSTSPPYVKGANHAEEIDFVLGFSYYNLGYDLAATVPDEEIQLSLAMMKYWTHFGKTGDVNNQNGSLQHWPEYTMANQEYIVFQASNQFPIRTRMRDEHVHFWNEVIPAIKKSGEQCVNEENKSDDVNNAEQLHLSTSLICVASIWCYAMTY